MIGDLVILTGELLEVDVEIEFDNQRVRSGKRQVERLFCDNSKVLKKINWKPDCNLKNGLQESIDWMKMNKYKTDIHND